jgi:hypothetical protein
MRWRIGMFEGMWPSGYSQSIKYDARSNGPERSAKMTGGMVHGDI